MKTKMFLLLSDVVLMGLISSFTTLAVLILTAVINARMKRVEKQQGLSIKQQAENHEQMDGHMTQLLEITASSNKAEGKLEGKEEQKIKMVPLIEEKVKAAKDAGKIEGIEQANGKKNGEENSNQ